MSRTVGFIGLGVMGRPMAGYILDALSASGGTLLVNNFVREAADDLIARGARWASPAEMAEQADTIIFMVPDLPQVAESVDGPDGICAHAAGPLVLVVCSTTSATGLVEFAERVKRESEGRVRVVDAPVSGGQTGADAGTISIMVGGEDDAVAQVMPLLAACGNPVHMGASGTGQITKACNQMIVAATIMALGEATALAEAAGIDVRAMYSLLAGGYAGSTIMTDKAERFAAHDHSPSGPAKFLVKDLGSALDVAAAYGVYTPLTKLARREFIGLTDAGYGSQDTAVIQAWIDAHRRAASTATHVVVMGPSGVGKSTTAKRLADKLGWQYVEGDALHPEANRAKMTAGTALTDEDRAPWLETIAAELSRHAAEGQSTVVTCSALKRAYREKIADADGNVVFVELTADPAVIARRIGGRTGHYMPPDLLQSQLEALEPLDDDENGIQQDTTLGPAEVADAIIGRLRLG